jgi:Zn-dependent protease with chaperone function
MARAGQLSSDAAPGSRSHGAESVATGSALLLCILARLPQHATDAAGVRSWGATLVVAVMIVSGARALARAPFTLARSLRTTPDRAAALKQWAGTEATTVVVMVVAGTLVTFPLYALLRSTPAWWLPAWLVVAAVTVVWQAAMPLAIRTQAGPLTDPPVALAERMKALAIAVGVDVPGGVAVATKPGKHRCNAYVVGFGPARQVVLEEGVAAWPPELVDQAVAHELGHLRLHHGAARLPLTLLAQLATLAATAAVLSHQTLLHRAGIIDIGDPHSYPLLLVAGGLVALPARCVLAWRDRAQERAADRFAIVELHKPDDFVAMLQRVAEETGTPRDLVWWRRLTASHPPVDERTAAASAPLSLDFRPTGA